LSRLFEYQPEPADAFLRRLNSVDIVRGKILEFLIIMLKMVIGQDGQGKMNSTVKELLLVTFRPRQVEMNSQVKSRHTQVRIKSQCSSEGWIS
jgi:hypothetical protein